MYYLTRTPRLHATCKLGAHSNQRRTLNALELELWTAVSCHVSAGNRTWILCKEKYFYPLIIFPVHESISLRQPDKSLSLSSSPHLSLFPLSGELKDTMQIKRKEPMSKQSKKSGSQRFQAVPYPQSVRSNHFHHDSHITCHFLLCCHLSWCVKAVVSAGTIVPPYYGHCPAVIHIHSKNKRQRKNKN